MPNSNPMQFEVEGQPSFSTEDTGNDNPAESSPDQTDNVKTPSSGEEENPDAIQKPDDVNTPKDDSKEIESLDKHPRWKEREDDWKERFNAQEQRHADEIAKLRQEFLENKSSKDTKEDDTSSTEVPEWFGGDENQWKSFLKWNQKVKEDAKAEALKEFNSKSESEKKAIEDANNYLNEEIKAIQSDKEINPNGLKVDRDKLLKFVLDNELVDTKGRWNYRAGWKMLQATQTKPVDNTNLNNKKAIAGATTSGKGSEPQKPEFLTSEDFANPNNRPW